MTETREAPEARPAWPHRRDTNPDTGKDETFCALDSMPWPCPSQRWVDGVVALVRELAETVHQTGSIRDHVDTTDRTGWNVRGIETCGDPLCIEARALLDPEPKP